MSKKIYLATHFFNEVGLKWSKNLATKIRSKTDFEVYLPQENDDINDKEDVEEVTAVDIFDADVDELKSTDILVASLDGQAIDTGVACEIGYFAYKCSALKGFDDNIKDHDKRNLPKIIGLYTDMRQSGDGEHGLYRNLFVKGAVEKYGQTVSSSLELIELLKSLEGEINK